MISYLEQIKNNVYILTEQEQSPKIDLQIESIIAEILLYCYREELIQQMVVPVSEVIASTLNNRAVTGFERQIANYREGDMSMSFANESNVSWDIKYNGKLESFKLIRGMREDV